MNPLYQAVFALSFDEKLQLVQDLWDHLAATPESIPMPEWHKEELDRRLAEVENNSAKLLNWDEVKASIRAQRGK
jgi:putative addiction module component (TIGR02574 family)